jgi:antitoxin ParD1/3/4
MANGTLLIGEYFESYVEQQVKTGRFSSSSEVMRAALRLLEKEENKTQRLINELKTGETSGMLPHFDRKQALSNLHTKYLHNEV